MRPFSNDLISAYLDGAVSPSERKEVDDSLAVDHRARHQYEELKATKNSLSALPKFKLEKDFHTKVIAAVHSASAAASQNGEQVLEGQRLDGHYVVEPFSGAGTTRRTKATLSLAVAASVLLCAMLFVSKYVQTNNNQSGTLARSSKYGAPAEAGQRNPLPADGGVPTDWAAVADPKNSQVWDSQVGESQAARLQLPAPDDGSGEWSFKQGFGRGAEGAPGIPGAFGGGGGFGAQGGGPGGGGAGGGPQPALGASSGVQAPGGAPNPTSALGQWGGQRQTEGHPSDRNPGEPPTQFFAMDSKRVSEQEALRRFHLSFQPADAQLLICDVAEAKDFALFEDALVNQGISVQLHANEKVEQLGDNETRGDKLSAGDKGAEKATGNAAKKTDDNKADDNGDRKALADAAELPKTERSLAKDAAAATYRVYVVDAAAEQLDGVLAQFELTKGAEVVSRKKLSAHLATTTVVAEQLSLQRQNGQEAGQKGQQRFRLDRDGLAEKRELPETRAENAESKKELPKQDQLAARSDRGAGNVGRAAAMPLPPANLGGRVEATGGEAKIATKPAIQNSGDDQPLAKQTIRSIVILRVNKSAALAGEAPAVQTPANPPAASPAK